MFIIDTAVRGERKFASPHLFLVSRARQYPAFAKAVLLCILITGMLVYRRPDQFSAPYVWVEEMLVLRDFSEQGLLAVFGTVAGFQYLATRLLLVLSFQSSILHAPAINVALTVAFTCFVALNICFAPTHLRGRFFCAVATLVIPTGAEVYAVAIYTFWWAGLLAILALIWRNEQQAWRLSLLLIGGLTSPIIIPLAPLYVVRAYFEPTRSNKVAAAIALLCALAGVITMLLALGNAGNPSPKMPDVTWILPIIGKFGGWFTSSAFLNSHKNVNRWGIIALIGAIGLLYGARGKLDRFFGLLGATVLLAAAAAMLRASVHDMHAMYAAPRYFFYPFILISWMLIWIAYESRGTIRLLAIAVLVGGFGQGLTSIYFRWRHDHLDWKHHVLACSRSPSEYGLPIHYMGGSANPAPQTPPWHLLLSGPQCRSLLDRSWLTAR
jgi:hypothetical protein